MVTSCDTCLCVRKRHLKLKLTELTTCFFYMTNGHLENNEPSNNIKATRWVKYKEVISKLFPANKRRSMEAALNQRWVTY